MSKVYRMDIPGWRPHLDNELVGKHWGAVCSKKRRDADQVSLGMLAHGVPRAEHRRRVAITISGRYGRFPDPFAPLKSALDALVKAGALVDDSDQWCLCEIPRYERGPKATRIELEDLCE